MEITKAESGIPLSSRSAALAKWIEQQLPKTGCTTSRGPFTNEKVVTCDGKIEICVQVMQNGTIERLVLYVQPTITVEELKKALHRLDGQGPPDNQRLIYSGKELEDVSTLKDHNIKGGVIYIVKHGDDDLLVLMKK